MASVPPETDVAGTARGLCWPLANLHQGKARRAVTSTSSSSSASSSSGSPTVSRPGSDSDARPISVLIADDQRLVRAVSASSCSEPDIEVVGEAADGLQAVGWPRPAADVVLMDIRMPRLDGLEAARRIIDGGATACRS